MSRYCSDRTFTVTRPASLDFPRDNSVMFVSKEYLGNAMALLNCKNCLVFWPSDMSVPYEISAIHAIVKTDNVRNSFCLFFRENGIRNLPPKEEFDVIDGAIVAKGAVIGKGTIIMPGAYIGGEVQLGKNCYVGSGSRLVGVIRVGDNVVIRENTVIGADGLSTDRDEDGRAITMPQFGRVVIKDNVQIGALVTIARGAIDDTVIGNGAKIDNGSFISHNVRIGDDTFIVGETIMFGSSSADERVLISGNSTIRNGCHIGKEATIGMGSVVVRDVADGSVVLGNPAKQRC